MKYAIIFTLLAGLIAASGLFSIANAANYAPVWSVWSPSSHYNAYVGETLSLWVVAGDEEREELTYSAVSIPSGADFNDQTFSWRPTSSQVGTHTITLRVYDGHTSVDKDINVTVEGNGGGTTDGSSNPSTTSTTGNHAPQFVNFNPPATVIEGQLYFYTVHAIDQNNDVISYRLVDGPPGMLFNSTFGNITWLTGFNDGRATPYVITIAASDGKEEVRRTFTVTVIDAVASPVPQTGNTVYVEVPEGLKIHNLNVITDERGEVIVYWETNKISTHRVIYGTDSERTKTKDFTYSNATMESESATITHSVTLSDLEINTPHYLRAVSKAGSEVEVSDEIIVIRLPDRSITTLGLASLLGAMGGFFGDHPVLLTFIFTAMILGTLLYLRWRNDRILQ